MFEVGFSELLLIMGLALLVLGPEKLPKVVSEIGRWMGRARAMARQFREQLEDESLEFGKRRQTPPAGASPATGDSTTPVEPSVTDTPAVGTPSLEEAVQRHAEAALPDHVPLGGDTLDPFPETPAAETPAAEAPATDAPAANSDRPGT